MNLEYAHHIIGLRIRDHGMTGRSIIGLGPLSAPVSNTQAILKLLYDTISDTRFSPMHVLKSKDISS